MKKPIPNRPVFDPASRTLDFSGTPGFDVRRLYGVTNIRTGELIYSPIRPSLAPASIAGSVITLSFNTNGMLAGDPLFIQYNDGINDLPPDAATASRQDALKLVLQDIRDSIRAQRSETIWTDDTGTRFIRLDNAGTISWTDVAGNASAPPGAGARPDSDSSTVVSQSTYRAIADGAGFSAQDYLNHVIVTDGDAGDLVSNFWLNVTAGTKIAAPSAAGITPLAPLPDGAATAARQDTGNTSLASIATGIGTPADTNPGSDAAAGSIIARLARLLASTTGLANILTNILAAFAPLAADASVQAGTAKAEAIRALLAGTLKVATPTPASIVTGQVKIATTGTAVALPNVALVNGIVVKAKTSNAPQTAPAPGVVGPAGVTPMIDGTGTGYPLAPGEAASFACSNANLVYVNGTAGDVFYFEGN